MADIAEVQPKPDTQPTAEVEPTTPESPAAPSPAKAGAIPDEVLSIPAVQAVLAGKPAAVSAPIEEFAKRPEAAAIVENKDALLKAGFGLYRSLAGNVGVLFNTLHLHPEELKQADKAGQLLKIAPSFDQVNAAVSSSGANHPILNTTSVPAGPKGAPMPTPPQAATAPMPPPPASVQKRAMNARVTNLQPGAPTSGPQPGAGRLLNSILKPVA